MEYLFSYGTLQKAAVQIELFGREVTSVADVMIGYQVRPILLDGETHKLAIVQPGGATPGMLLALTPAEIAICDNYEPTEYQRVQVDLQSGQTAWAYVAAETNL